jgi:hypothetical protein
VQLTRNDHAESITREQALVPPNGQSRSFKQPNDWLNACTIHVLVAEEDVGHGKRSDI